MGKGETFFSKSALDQKLFLSTSGLRFLPIPNRQPVSWIHWSPSRTIPVLLKGRKVTLDCLVQSHCSETTDLNRTRHHPGVCSRWESQHCCLPFADWTLTFLVSDSAIEFPGILYGIHETTNIMNKGFFLWFIRVKVPTHFNPFCVCFLTYLYLEDRIIIDSIVQKLIKSPA